MSTSIDLSRVPPPKLLEDVSFEPIQQGFIARFLAKWASARAKKPSLPAYDVELLETDPAIVIGQAVSELRLLDRIRVNDAALGLLAPTAQRADLDNVAARMNVERQVVTPANPTTGEPAILQDDDTFRTFYLESFDVPSAGSSARYRYEARKAWPAIGDVDVVGRAIHGRRGDTDVVVMGPGGRVPTDAELATVSAAVRAENVRPEAVAVAALPSRRIGYSARLAILVSIGPDKELVRKEALARVEAAATERRRIGGQIPAGFLRAAAFGPNVIDVVDMAPVEIAPDPYAHPAFDAIEITAEAPADGRA